MPQTWKKQFNLAFNKMNLKISQFKGLNRIHSLKQHYHNIISKKAHDLIDTFFNQEDISDLMENFNL